MAVRPYLGMDDLPLVLEVLHCSTSLEETLYAARIIEKKITYPIVSLANLKSAFSWNQRIALGERTLRPQDLGECLPEETFPIESRTELVSRLVMGFERIRMAPIHQIAQQQGAEVAWGIDENIGGVENAIG
jgi:hypothetical protein